MPRATLTARQLAEGRQLAQALRVARISRQAAQSTLAERSGVSLDMVRKMELEKVPSPSFFTVARLARHLDLTLDTLTADAERAGQGAEAASKN